MDPLQGDPPPSAEELDSFVIRLRKGSTTDQENRVWLARMIDAHRSKPDADAVRRLLFHAYIASPMAAGAARARADEDMKALLEP